MNEYKYNPADFAYSPCLSAEMEDYYSLFEKYQADKTKLNWSFLDKQRIDLFFSIKHRVVEGYLTQAQAQEMRDYYGELFDTESE
jgi:hypothetical protein